MRGFSLSSGAITRTDYEHSARGCRARLPREAVTSHSHLISMVSPLARSLALTHGTCSSHNMHAVHKSPWPCQVTAQAAQIVAHSMTSVSGGRISARLHPSSVHRDTQSYRAEALPSHTLAARSHDEPRAGQRVEDDHHLQRDVDGLQSCCHRRPAAGSWS